jgi:hypothetical protein
LWLSPATVTLSPFGFLYGGGDGGNTVGAGVGDSPGHGGDTEGAGVGAVGAAESAAGIGVGAVGAAESAAGIGVGAVRMSFPNPKTSTLAS